jgi:hypothetical protein
MELKGCPDGKDSTQECFDSHIFEFVEDMAYDMPAGKLLPMNQEGLSAVSTLFVSHQLFASRSKPS